MNQKLASFFYENYPTAKENLSIDICLKMIERFHKVYRVDNFGRIKFLALYLKVNDEFFDKIEDLKDVSKNELFIKNCLVQNGNNAICMYCIGNGIVNILRSLRELSNGMKTVSWYRNDMNKLHRIKIRRKVCLSH